MTTGTTASSATAARSLAPDDSARILGERHSQQVTTAFILAGLIFMLLPGTFLGVWNLLSISATHGPESVPQAWLQAHGQAQIFGWIGSFILGIGFYSLTKMRSTRAFPTSAAWTAWALWITGVLLRWLGGVTSDAWRTLFPVSAALELAAFLIFYLAVRRHRPAATPTKSADNNTWMRLVAVASVAFLVTLVVNTWMLTDQAVRGASPALPHIPDQQFVVLALWGMLVPTIWGFNARWLPVFLGLPTPRPRLILVAYTLSVVGLVATYLQRLSIASAAFFLAAILAIDALHVWKRAIHPPKIIGVHRSFPWFVRLSYAWLLISTILALMAVPLDTAGGLWGASRHALTVGFVAAMVFAIGQRVLPAFCGMKVLWSTRLMFASLALLFIGCFLRVLAEPLAYDGWWHPAWKILPISAYIELAAVVAFAINLGVTLLQPPAHLKAKTTA